MSDQTITAYSHSATAAEIAAQRIVIAAFQGDALKLSQVSANLDDGPAVGKFLGEVTNALRDTLLKKA